MSVTKLGMPAIFQILTLISLLLAPTPIVSQTCYDPSGNTLGGFGVCDNAANVSLCCPVSTVCNSNGLCLNSLTGNFNRGGCTDKSFNDPACPAYCTTVSYPGILPCNTTSINPFCCDSQAKGQCCQDPSSLLSIGPAISSAYAVSPIAKTARPSSTSGSGSGSATTTPTSSPASSNSSSTSSPSPMVNAGQSNASVQIGVGVGVGVGGLAAMIALAFLCYHRRKKTHDTLQDKDEIPELPPLLSHNRLNSKLFPAELDPEGEGLKGPAELEYMSSMQLGGPVELDTSPVELSAAPVELGEGAIQGSPQATTVGSRVSSVKKDKHFFTSRKLTAPSAATSLASQDAITRSDSAHSPQVISHPRALHPESLQSSTPTANQASIPEHNQSPQVPPPPPPSIATIPSTADSTPQPSPLRGHHTNQSNGMALHHPNQSNWSMEQEQAKIRSPSKEAENPQRTQTIAERRKMGSPTLSSAGGPWHDTYNATTGEATSGGAGSGN